MAGGRGLLALEAICPEIEKVYGVEIEIWGFDTGEGLPEPVDYRDLPYIWQAGFYRMDHAALEAKLKRARLVLGDVKHTVPTFFEAHTPAPLGAAFFDLDFWSSTHDSFGIFSGSPETLLPRVFCYCDDVISSEGGGVLSEDVGQLRITILAQPCESCAQLPGLPRSVVFVRFGHTRFTCTMPSTIQIM